MPLWWLLSHLPIWAAGVAIAAFIGFACIVAGAAERIYGGHDVGHIVIDEVAGLLVCGLAVPFKAPWIVAAFVLFRLFDITKPGPVRWLDRNVGGGVGVVMDDVAAGLFGWVILQAAMALGAS